MTDFLYWLLVQQAAWWSGAISVVMMWKMGSRVWWAPFLGLVGQIFWGLLAWLTNQPGLMLTVLVYTFVHARNARKWWLERQTVTRRLAQHVGRPPKNHEQVSWPTLRVGYDEVTITPGNKPEREVFIAPTKVEREPQRRLRWIDSPHGRGEWSNPPHG